MKAMMIGLVLAFFTLTSNEGLTGKWETKPSVNGNITGVIFKADYSFEGYVNKKPFVSGTYQFRDNILSFVDNGCDGRRGIYRVDFFSNADSLRFIPIADSCEERNQGMSRLVMGRIK